VGSTITLGGTISKVLNNYSFKLRLFHYKIFSNIKCFSDVNDFKENVFFFFSSVWLHSKKMLMKIFYDVWHDINKNKNKNKKPKILNSYN
jgi:hypothetical protein